jgi:hypothetical protein
MKKYPCVESTYEFISGGYRIRLWRDQGIVKNEYDDSDFKNVADKNNHLSLGEYTEVLAAVDRVNAVHVTNILTGKGIVVYVNWP